MNDWRTFLSQFYKHITGKYRFFSDYHRYYFVCENERIGASIYNDSDEHIE